MIKIKKLQAREIIRAAKHYGIPLKRGDRRVCAIGVICKDYGIDSWDGSKQISQKTSFNMNDLIALEAGFEGNEIPSIEIDSDFNSSAPIDNRYVQMKDMPMIRKNRYYRVGQRVAELAGLSNLLTYKG